MDLLIFFFFKATGGGVYLIYILLMREHFCIRAKYMSLDLIFTNICPIRTERFLYHTVLSGK